MGVLQQTWDRLDAYHVLGVQPAGMSGSQPIPSVERSAGPGLLDGDGRPWHPDSPLFWFGILAAATLGFIAASTSIRVGPFRAAVAAGKP